MAISTNPLNSNTPSGSKLVISSLPKSPPVVAKPAALPEKKLQLATPQLSDAQLLEISKLKARDTQLRQHEQAHHAASAGVNVSSASFTYQRGPNGVSYAVSGDVSIDTSAPTAPEARLMQAAMIADVALAPADPTPTDRAVAAKAQQMAQQARVDILQQEGKSTNQQAVHSATASYSQDSQSQGNGKPPAKRIDTFA